MALEDKIDELIAALNANTEAYRGAGGAGGTKTTGSSKPSGGGKKGPTLDTVAKRYGAYMSAEGEDGKAMVRKVVSHFGVKKVSDLDESQFDEALELLDKIEAGDDPFSSDDGDDLM